MENSKEMRIKEIGTPAKFLIPSQKAIWTTILHAQKPRSFTVARLIHNFLFYNFGRFTISSGHIEEHRQVRQYTEYKEYRFAIEEKKIEKLQEFLAEVCVHLKEESIYLEIGTKAILVYP